MRPPNQRDAAVTAAAAGTAGTTGGLDSLRALWVELRDLQRQALVLSRQIQAERARAQAARTSWDLFQDALAERVVPLSRKDLLDAPQRRLAALNRSLVRINREVQHLTEECRRLGDRHAALTGRSDPPVAHQRPGQGSWDRLVPEQLRLAARTGELLAAIERRLERIEVRCR